VIRRAKQHCNKPKIGWRATTFLLPHGNPAGKYNYCGLQGFEESFEAPVSHLMAHAAAAAAAPAAAAVDGASPVPSEMAPSFAGHVSERR